MPSRYPTLAHALHQPTPYSFWRRSLQGRAGDLAVQDWLVEQANLRGYHGAYGSREITRPRDATLTLEEIVVGLCAPQAPAEGRIFKLVVRILQSGLLDPVHLCWLARREQASMVLWWLLGHIPGEERTESVALIAQRLGGAPRGYRGFWYRYDPGRLVRRPFRREELCLPIRQS